MKTIKQFTSTAALLLLLAPNFANGKKNFLGNLMNEPSPENLDAATGTVLSEDGKKDMSCDGQLAAALVEAKELAAKTQKELDEESAKHKASLELIVDLQKNLASANADMIKEKDARIEIAATMDGAVQEEREKGSKTLQSFVSEAKAELEALREEKDGIIVGLKEEAASTLESQKALADKKFLDLKTEKDKNIANLEAKLKMSTDELQETMRLELEKAKDDRETKVAQLTAEKNAAVDELTQKMADAAKEASELLQKTKEAAAAEIEQVQADRDEQLEAMLKKMEKMEATSKQETGEITAEYEEKLSEKLSNIDSLQGKAEKLTETIAVTQQALEEANAEITHWRDLHAQRSYCNMTHVAVDLYDASAFVYEKASNKAADVFDVCRKEAGVQVSKGLEFSSDFINGQFDEHWPKVAPYYDDIIVANYLKIQPQLQEHVYPKISEAATFTNDVLKPKVLEAIDDGRKTVTPIIEQNMQGAADLYENYCRSSLTEFLKATDEVEVLKEHPPPAFLLESWETSCENSRDSITVLAQGTGILLAVIFYRRILRFTWSIVVFFLMFFVRLTPLRFFIRTKKTKDIESCTESPPSPPSSPSPPAMAASSESLMKAVIDDEDENNVEPEGEAAATLY